MANETINLVNDAWVEYSGGNAGGFCGVGDTSTSPDFYNGALRFTNVTINQGASLNFAALVYIYDSVGTGTGSWKHLVNGIKETNTAVLDASAFSRTKTTAQITVNEGAPTAGGTKTYNVTSIVQEIINQGGWSSGNAIGFLFNNNASDTDVHAFADLTTSYLAYRVAAEPNFTPTPINVNAPSLPVAKDFGMMISRPGVNVLTAAEGDQFFTSRKRQIKIFKEGLYTSSSGTNKTIVHGLGYVPLVSVYSKDTGSWFKISGVGATFVDQKSYSIDKYNLTLHSTASGEEFYYRIFLDRAAT